MTARILVAGAIGPAARSLAERLRAEYFCVAACAGEVAVLERVHAWKPDAIVLECVPDDAELTLYRRLRSEPACRDLALLLLLPGSDAAARLRGLEAGADDVLEAPPDMDLLLVRFPALLRSRLLRDTWRIRSEDLSGLSLSADMPGPGSVVGARVLVIDDDDAAVAAVQDGLARDGVATGRADTAARARALCAAMAFDLVAVGLGMIADDPLRIVAELRADESTRNVAQLLLAPPHHRPRLLRGLALGADDWLAWPPGGLAAAPEFLAELRARVHNRLRHKFRQDRLRADLGHAFEIALTDPLTGCYNRRHVLRQLQALLSVAPVQGLAVLLVDIDRFKAVNGRLGYAAADEVLARFADLLRRLVRGLDSVGRLGGEEFVVVMPGCTLADALKAAERLRCQVEERAISIESGESVQLTISIGVAGCDPLTKPPTPERLLHIAGQALAAARAAGGNVAVGDQALVSAAAA